MSDSSTGWSGFLNRLSGQGGKSSANDGHRVQTVSAVLPRSETQGLKKEEYVVIGLGRFGASVAVTLASYDYNVLAIDNDKDRVQALSTALPNIMQLDATNIDALRQAGVDAFDTGIVCIGTDFESNILTTVLLRKLGVSRVIAKARTRTQREILMQVGADEVVLPEHEAGVRLARRLAAGHVIDYLEVSKDVGVVELLAPPSFWGHTLAETDLRQRYGLNAMAVRRGEELIVIPSGSFEIEENDVLVVLGKIEDAERLTK
jgi:trk system potassium uptake protein TrkA